jgi:hypothetical protein
VPVQILTGPDKLVDAFAALAGPLGVAVNSQPKGHSHD